MRKFKYLRNKDIIKFRIIDIISILLIHGIKQSWAERLSFIQNFLIWEVLMDCLFSDRLRSIFQSFNWSMYIDGSTWDLVFKSTSSASPYFFRLPFHEGMKYLHLHSSPPPPPKTKGSIEIKFIFSIEQKQSKTGILITNLPI